MSVDARISPLLNLAAKKESISNPQYNITRAVTKGDGYMSVIYNVRIKDNDDEVLSVIAKISPENKVFREQSSVGTLYINEVIFYDEIYPAFYKFQAEKGIEEIFDFAPKCYATITEEGKEGLVLENLKDKGYRMYNRMVPMDEIHIEVTLKAYAKYHALNFAFKDQHREEFDQFCSKIKDFQEMIASKPVFEAAYDRMVETNLGYLDSVEDERYMETFKKYIYSLKDQRELFFSRNMDDYSVIGHGDCWCNNMIYKYDDPSNPTKPTGIRFFDFQLIRHTTPITDFTHFFYTASSNEIQDNLEYYLNLYYDTLVHFVERLGSDPEKVYPKSVFDAHWKKYSTNGLNVALWFIRVMTSQADETPDFNDMTDDESLLNAMDYKPKDSGYRQRVRDIILHFCNRGLI